MSTCALAFAALLSCDRSAKEGGNPPVPMVAATPATGLTTTTIVFDCTQSQSGNKQDKLYFRWDWNNDGLWDTEFSGDPVFKHRFYSKGVYPVAMEALNSSGLTDTCRLPVTIGQGYSAPRALFKITPETGNRLTEYTFDATVTKDDEDSLNLLQFRWDWEGDGRWDTGFNPPYVVKHTYYETGSYQPLMEVKDPSGLLHQYQTKLEVTRTNPRLLAHFNWTPVHPLQNDTVVFDASLSMNLDDPAQQLIYYWKFETGEPLKTSVWQGPFYEPVISRAFKMEYEYLVSLRIVDALGLENEIARPVMIFHLNRPPTPRFHVSTPLGNLTTQFLLNAWITNDAEDLPSTLKVRWDFEGDSRWDTEFSTDKILYHRFDSPGTYKIVLEAMDTQGLTDTTSAYVQVTPGTNETGLIIDRRFDTEEYYPTVKIGNQWWMARNMYFEPYMTSDKIDTLRSTCYDDGNMPWWKNVGYYCYKWGRLYTAYSAASMNMRERAQGICPNGWHLPTRKEFETLITSIGGYSAARELLPGGSTDFNALYVGLGEKVLKSNGVFTWYEFEFRGFGSITYFWSSTPLNGQGAMSHWTLTLIKGIDEISKGFQDNASFLSVRCIKNE
ncbi:MAG: hypothetical protein NTV01_21550 [Bacteroidia bacterium]|nr:hypothetical protein [Bacteroidia bacterium]